jgi:hypothetical protein
LPHEPDRLEQHGDCRALVERIAVSQKRFAAIPKNARMFPRGGDARG